MLPWVCTLKGARYSNRARSWISLTFHKNQLTFMSGDEKSINFVSGDETLYCRNGCVLLLCKSQRESIRILSSLACLQILWRSRQQHWVFCREKAGSRNKPAWRPPGTLAPALPGEKDPQHQNGYVAPKSQCRSFLRAPSLMARTETRLVLQLDSWLDQAVSYCNSFAQKCIKLAMLAKLHLLFFLVFVAAP